MSKTLIIALVTAAVAATGGIAYFLFSGTSDAAMAQRAISGQGSVTCTFSSVEMGGDGTMYVRNGDMRIVSVIPGGITGEVEDSDAESHMLYKDDTVYVWTDGEDQGFKMSAAGDSGDFDPENDLPFGGHENEDELEREFEENQVSCSRGADRSMFNLPSDVDFIDYSTLFEDFVQDETDGAGMDFDMESEISEEELEEIMRQLDAQAQ